MTTYTFFSDLQSAVTFARAQNADHGRVHGIRKTTHGYGANAEHGYHVLMFKRLVVEDVERNGYDDSDFFAHWFDPETEEHGSYMYATTRGWTYANGCTIDGDLEAHRAWRARVDEESRKRREKREAEAAAKIPQKGTTVRVKSKRSKVPHGTEGEVFYFAMSAYGPDPDRYRNPYTGVIMTKSEELLGKLKHYRVGFRTADGTKHFCSASCLEVLKPAPEKTGV